ncbi:MAG: hypothetical protein PUG33_07635 [Mollicutes bacterium]|nr:hypothetical protein [Mollicutes bacterium]
MKIMRMNYNWNKINTREELIELLKGYKGILADSMINYLNSLIDLEFSVIRDYISDNDRVALSELEVYKRIAMYNIYNRALNIFKQNESELEISGNNDGIEGLEVYASLGEKRSCKLFDFDYHEGRPMSLSSKIPSDYKTMKIGNISLFQTIDSKEQREAELMRVMSILGRLYDEKNPYHSRPHTYGGPAPQWAYEHAQKIKAYEEKFNQLDAKEELTDEDKKEIEITKKFHELLLEDYGLTNKDFENNQQFSGFGKEKTELQKTLVRRMPNINIENNIKYI